MTGTVKSIDCTNCGAGLDVLGGGRVVVKVCSYCGAALDASDAYRVIEVYDKVKRPPSPFSLGQTGTIDGVEFTIIGTISKSERDGGDFWNWVDHMLYSPTHGYGWLTVEDGHLLFTRKVRDWPLGGFVTSHRVEMSEVPPSSTWRGQRYKYFATSEWRTDFVEGEFNWRPKRGARGTTVTMMPGGAASNMLAFVQGPEEREVEVTRYCPEAAEAFGIAPPQRIGTHPLQPFEAMEGSWFYKAFFGGMAGLAAVLALVSLLVQPAPVTLYDGPGNAVPEVMTFDVDRVDRPVTLNFRHAISNAWSELGITVIAPDGTPVADTFRSVSFYSGRDSEGTWTEGSRSTALGFRPPQTGTFQVQIEVEGESRGARREPLRVMAQTGRTNPVWAALAALGFGLAFVWVATQRFRHRLLRWHGSDWSED